MSEWPLLTCITLFPLLGAVLILLLPGNGAGVSRVTALVVSWMTLFVVGLIWLNFDPATSAMQFEQKVTWIPSLGVDYHLGIDGLGLVMVLLAALLVPFALHVSPGGEGKGYYALILFLETGLMGTFTTLNFVHWFVFWEIALIPAFFLIKNWGGRGADKAAVQFFIYTMVGSVGLLLAFLALFLGANSLGADEPFGFLQLAELARDGRLAGGVAEAMRSFGMQTATHGLMPLVFFLAFLGFAVKLPIWPFHTWLPSTYADAPTPVTMLLTGAMSKMGAYGLIRVLLPVFPNEIQLFQRPLLLLALASVVLGAAAALSQKDLKRVLAYSSINHLGYVALAVFASMAYTFPGQASAVARAAALNGAGLQMFNHGITAAALFGFVAFIERRTSGLRGIDDFGGVRKVAPVFCGLMGVSLFASLGLPGLNGFVGEFLIFKGVFGLVPWAAVFATPGLLFTAWFLLNILQKVFSGPLNERWQDFPDLTRREVMIMAPASLLMLVVGVWPQSVIGLLNETMTALAAGLGN